jgi:hypothetical protein
MSSTSEESHYEGRGKRRQRRKQTMGKQRGMERSRKKTEIDN